MPDDLDIALESDPVLEMEPLVEEVPVVVEPEPVEYAPAVESESGEPPMQKFKVNARHSNCPNRWETVEARDEEEARRLFLQRYSGEIVAVKPGEAKPNER